MVQNILVLGSGMVSSCMLSLLCREPVSRYKITVGSNLLDQLDNLRTLYPQIRIYHLDVTVDEYKLRALIENADLVISLLTNDLQFPIAKRCVELKTHMVHASYCTKEILDLDQSARENGVTILNEMGLDPGIDHILAMKSINELRAEPGTKITGYLSYCGGLPEPKVAQQNPLRYKFSWSPLTSLRNLLNPARYLYNNQVIEIPSGGDLIDAIHESADTFPSQDIHFESYPNRDSLAYKDLYGIQDASTVLRGTYRYKGFKDTLKTLFQLGLLSDAPTEAIRQNQQIQSWGDLIRKLMSEESRNSPLEDILARKGFSLEDIQRLNDLGLTETSPVTIQSSLLETLADHLSSRLQFVAQERDVVFMTHQIHYERNMKKGKREIKFVAFGEQDKNGFSAMSKTVGVTIVHAVKLLLNGSIQRPGVIYPFNADIYEPILQELQKEGYQFSEIDSLM